MGNKHLGNGIWKVLYRNVFLEYFGDNPPARMSTTTEFLCSECLVMIDGVAYLDE